MERESAWGSIVAVLVISVAIGFGAFALVNSRPEPMTIVVNPPLPTATPQPTATPPPIRVYITGAVQTSQVTISLPYASRVSDAIASVGGMTADADMNGVNLAGLLRDGDHVHVPSISSTLNQPLALPTASGGDVVYINTATLDELQTLPGVGPVLAQRIIDYRTNNGRITSLDDLDNVSGIGPATLANLAPLVSFD